eukprot:907740-Amphidinium_carterae.1
MTYCIKDARSSEYDARDIFGDMSDDEAEKVEDVVVRTLERNRLQNATQEWRGICLLFAVQGFGQLWWTKTPSETWFCMFETKRVQETSSLALVFKKSSEDPARLKSTS